MATQSSIQPDRARAGDDPIALLRIVREYFDAAGQRLPGLLGLAEHHARPDLRNRFGYSALMIACQEGDADIVTALLNAGAGRTLRNKKRETAMEIALASGHGALGKC